MSIDKFSKKTCEELKHYVYGLIDPRNGQVFYIGRGQGNRVFQHIKDSDNDDIKNNKINTIRDIKNAGLEVIHIIYRHGMDEKTAEAVEATLIDCIPGLTNIANGKGSSDYGISSAKLLEDRYARETFEDRKDISYMIIKIRRDKLESNGNEVYETVYKSWKVNKDKVDSIKYVLAVCEQVVLEVYEVNEWKPSKENPGRYEFKGDATTDKEISNYFKNKLIPEKYRQKGMASPTLYPDHVK